MAQRKSRVVSATIALCIALLCTSISCCASHKVHNHSSASSSQGEADGLLVSTPSGKLRGAYLESWTGNRFYSFRGIPYAEPPVGNLRFKAPVPVKAWDGIKDATKDGPVCTQAFSDVGPSSEDCLLLNVYSKKLDGSKPVIVYFHPGAFYSMTGASFWNGPQYLMDQDIVLVTINYRLDVLGFLSTDDGEAVGNYGLKDQVAAMRWVKSHISNFGGNPNNVTLAGYSAGSVSVFYHMLSPMSKGLFHRVIAMSAGVTSELLISRQPLERAKQLATLFNCSTTSVKDVVQCLRNVPENLINSKFEEMRTFSSQPMVVFGPVIEPEGGTSEERFLIDEPATLIKEKQFYHVPVVTGITKDEFLGWSMYVLRNETMTNELNANFNSLAPIILGYSNENKKRRRKITQAFRNFYLGGGPITNNSVDGLGKLFSDATIIYGEYATARLFARYNEAPVYFYKLQYLGRYGHIKDPDTDKAIGPTHHDDLIYLFYISKMFPKFTESDPEAFMVKYLTTLWSNFASTGNPTPTNSPIQWQPFSKSGLKYFNIDSILSMEEGLPYPDRMALWEKLFPIF